MMTVMMIMNVLFVLVPYLRTWKCIVLMMVMMIHHDESMMMINILFAGNIQ